MNNFSYKKGNNKIFIHVPTKKHYLGNIGLFKNQSAQKGGTCWYYVLNHLRVRYGKDFPNQNYLYRRVEKTISSFRKSIIEIENLTSEFIISLEALRFEYQTEEIDKEMAENHLKINQYVREKACSRFKERETQLLENFLIQSHFAHLNLFINHIILLKYVNNARYCLEELGINTNEALQSYLREQPHFELGNLTLVEEYKIFQNLVFLEAIKQYHLKMSKWHPSYKIECIIDYLANEGPLAVSGYFNFENDFLPDPNNYQMDSRPLYYLEKPIIADGDIGHAVLIIGAEINDSGEWIYYLDPNDSTETGKVYKISYYYLTSARCKEFLIF